MEKSTALAFSDETRVNRSLADRFGEVYQRWWPFVYARCRRLLRTRDQAEDAAQEVFLKILRQGTPPATDDELRHWVMRVTTNHCLNNLRDEKRRLAAAALLGKESDGFRDRVADREWLEHLLRSLPGDVGLVGWLNHVDELDQADIAARLQISRRTVVNRLSMFNARAKRALAGL